MPGFSLHGVGAQEENVLQLVPGPLEKKRLDVYRSKRASYHQFRAVSRLWAHGVDWDQARSIVSDAFQQSIQQG